MRLAWLFTCAVLPLLLLVGRDPDPPTRRVTLKLVDARSGRELPGLVRVTDSAGRSVSLPSLLGRGVGVAQQPEIKTWSVLPRALAVSLPRGTVTIEAVSGLETELARTTVDLSDKAPATVTLPLERFYSAAERGLRSANTHLHLMKISREQCDRYLREIPRADGLDMVFLSYLERAVEDQRYTSNRYTSQDLATLTRQSGTVFGNGEEHRHNFAGFGQGYGHVMLLNIKKLILPVSIGPGIMKTGHDGLPLRRGIQTARRDGATIVWCHNEWGLEALPNWLAGRVDAQNIYDGGIRSSYRDSFYRYLNAGLKVPFSTGTDWFMYDFSRVYVPVNGKLTPGNWLKQLATGHSYITNGPFLEFRVNRETIGGTVVLEKPGRLRISGRAVGRKDFRQIELMQNGGVIAHAATRPVAGHFEATIETTLDVATPGWLALRTPPPSVSGDPKRSRKTPLNLLGRELFAHSSPIYVEIGGRAIFDPTVARELLATMQKHAEAIKQNGKFLDAAARARVLDAHREGIALLQDRLAKDDTSRSR
ncbi:MAG: CehA/McbA family metallohydrolase [Planctomycetaceae bacterium]